MTVDRNSSVCQRCSMITLNRKFAVIVIGILLVCLSAGIISCGRASMPMIPEPQAVYYYYEGHIVALDMADSESVRIFRGNAGRLIESSDTMALIPVEESEPAALLATYGMAQAIFAETVTLRPDGPSGVCTLLIPLSGGPREGTYYIFGPDGWQRGYGGFYLAVEALFAQSSGLRGGEGVPRDNNEPFLGF